MASIPICLRQCHLSQIDGPYSFSSKSFAQPANRQRDIGHIEILGQDSACLDQQCEVFHNISETIPRRPALYLVRQR